jgi:hypothetical protein
VRISGPKNCSMEWNGNVMKIDKNLWNGMEVESK